MTLHAFVLFSSWREKFRDTVAHFRLFMVIMSNHGLTRLRKVRLVNFDQTVQLVFIFVYI